MASDATSLNPISPGNRDGPRVGHVRSGSGPAGPGLRRPLRLVTRRRMALSGVFTTSRIQLRARPRTQAQDRSEPSSLCARMRRASSSNFEGTNSSAGPTGNGSSAPSPISCTGMLSASSLPFAISASTTDEVHSTETRSSLTRSSWHVGSSPRDVGARAERHVR
jgi:hypothetical protein